MTIAFSPAIQLSADGVNWLATNAPLQVSSGAAFYARLASTANVDATSWAVSSTDDLGSAPALTVDPMAIASSKVSGTAGAAGTAFILQSTINGGVDKNTDNVNPNTTQATAIVEVLAANGLAVIAYDEHYEHGPQSYLPKWNAAIRGAAGGAAGGVPTTRTISTTAPLTGGGDLSANRTLGISAATDSTAGSMSAADKTKLDAATSTPTAGDLILYNASGGVTTNGVSAPPVSAPAAPASGWIVYVDSADDRLKAIDPSGRIVLLSKTMILTNTKTISVTGTQHVPVFGITGTVRVLKLYGEVETAISSNHTAEGWRLNDQTAQVALTASTVGPLSSAPAGSMIAALVDTSSGNTLAAPFVNTAGLAVTLYGLIPRIFAELLLTQKSGAATNVEYGYSSTDTPPSGVIKFFIEYEPISDDGAVAAL